MPSGIYKHKKGQGGRKGKSGVYLRTKKRNGWKLSEEQRKKMRKPKSKKTRRKMSLGKGGTGISVRREKRYYHLLDSKYVEWRSKVFERDGWTCQTCGERGCYLEAHHIKGWTKYPKLRYEVENGVSLCKKCHLLTRKKQ